MPQHAFQSGQEAGLAATVAHARVYTHGGLAESASPHVADNQLDKISCLAKSPLYASANRPDVIFTVASGLNGVFSWLHFCCDRNLSRCLAKQRAMRRPNHHPLPSLLASAAHSGPLRETAGRRHDHGPGRLNLVAKNTAPIELVHPRAVGDAESVQMDGWGADSMGRGCRRGRAYSDQHKRRDDFASRRSRNGLATVPSHRLAGSRGPLP
jgi:hypothetical protein